MQGRSLTLAFLHVIKITIAFRMCYLLLKYKLYGLKIQYSVYRWKHIKISQNERNLQLTCKIFLTFIFQSEIMEPNFDY